MKGSEKMMDDTEIARVVRSKSLRSINSGVLAAGEWEIFARRMKGLRIGGASESTVRTKLATRILKTVGVNA